MPDCSNCHQTMAPLSLEAFGTLRPNEISVCAPCHLFWFDKSESVRLTPRSVLEVFQFIGRAGQATNTLASQFGCPICAKPTLADVRPAAGDALHLLALRQRSRTAHHVSQLPAREELHPRRRRTSS